MTAVLAILCLAASGCGQTSRRPEATMADAWEVFSEPKDENRTKVWWFHGETETTREGITADLEAYKRAGVGGVVYYDQVHGDGEGALPAFSGQWWEMLKFAASEARRVGLGFDINISNGYVAGGPWINDSLGMQRLLAADTVVKGGRKLRLELPEPDERVFRDVTVIAFPAKAGHIEKYCNWTREGDRLVMESDSAVTVRSISYRTVLKGKSRGGAMNEPGPPAEKFHSPSFKERPPVGTLEASDDGICMDSHEAGSQNWTPGFEKEFASRRGYSIMEYLPVMAGLVVDSSEKTIASAEAFTDMKYHQTFADMKVLADFAYANNVNEFVVCASAYQPWTDRVPGNTAGGRHYCLNRNNTYWEYSRSFWDYQARCAGVLRLGTPANDLCIYLGNNSPVKLQTYRLPEIPAGYGFDVCTADGLLEQTYGKDGKLKLKNGGEFGVLVIEDKSDVPEEVERHISRLKAESVPVCRGSGLADALREYGIKPDLVDSSRHTVDNKLHFGHRILADADLYFICNHSKDSYRGGISVRSGYSNVYWWNPLDGSRVRLDSYPDGEYRSVSMELAPEESGFLVVSDVQIDGLETRVPNAEEKTVEIAGPWEIFFDPAAGGCGTVSADELFDWSESEDPRIRYYSGSAIYSCTFDMDSVEPDSEVFLKFRKIGTIARVYVNGSTAGDVWFSPWKVEIGNLLREGRNELRIEVTNTLANRIIGDALKPASERSTYSATEIYRKEDKPYASGIMGQLCLEVRGNSYL